MNCALLSMLAYFFCSKTNQDNTSRYGQHFNELNSHGLYFDDGLKIKDIPNLYSRKNLNFSVFEHKINRDEPKLLTIYICQ